jgi:hypothetical protein
MSARAVPILPSRSITATRDFYERMGFSTMYYDDAAIGYLIVELGGVELQFFRHTALDPAKSDHGAYIRADDVDAFTQRFLQLALPVVGIPRFNPAEDRPWGMREAYLVDLDGNLIRIGQQIG